MSKAIVVGGGGGPTGLATAMLLAKRGVEVVVLDREAPAPSEVDDLWEQWERRCGLLRETNANPRYTKQDS
jgi:2-polyprenyl-6-methoxyphenol hydroxylase-like FAD-dependent oxidoreductase